MVKDCVAVYLELIAVLQYITSATLLPHNHVLFLTPLEHALLILTVKGFVGAAGDTVVLLVQAAHKVEVRVAFVASVILFPFSCEVPELVGQWAVFAHGNGLLVRLTRSGVWSG